MVDFWMVLGKELELYFQCVLRPDQEALGDLISPCGAAVLSVLGRGTGLCGTGWGQCEQAHLGWGGESLERLWFYFHGMHLTLLLSLTPPFVSHRFLPMF